MHSFILLFRIGVNIIAYFGMTDTNIKDGTQIKISKVIKHPYYFDFDNDYDIALLKLSSNITYNSLITPVCMPNGRNAIIGEKAIATGWVFIFLIKK
jgi:hypothetical protein